MCSGWSGFDTCLLLMPLLLLGFGLALLALLGGGRGGM
jgi:hypothetical protein